MFVAEHPGFDDRHRVKRGNSSSTDSPNGNSNNDSSPCTSDTGWYVYPDSSWKHIHVKARGTFTVGLNCLKQVICQSLMTYLA